MGIAQLAVVALLIGGCGSSEVEVTGTITTKRVFIEGSIEDYACGTHNVEVVNGEGAIVRVGQSEKGTGTDSQESDSRVIDRECVAKYSLTVPKSNVITVRIPGTDKIRVAGYSDQTVNLTGDAVTADFDYLYLT